MLPGVVASELREAVSRFLRSAFPIATPFFQRSEHAEHDAHALIDDLLARPGALFKGPYLDIKLPFRLATPDKLPFRHIELSFRPYQHQLAAFQRLCGDAPQSTIVATGTGSGKTECFMLPVLDDCLIRREQGIKTLVVYPMNALATDQARRFAQEIHKLDTRLTVGLFVGGEQKKAHTGMGPDHVITCQNTLRDNPPDILLTNYKMLDFLLLRPKDQPLWRYNGPGMLRYLVVDELHTFDGAQGTDLACLIRRLRDRLEAGTELACVGTSATMGVEAKEELLGYAARVFATDFDAGSIITEHRMTAEAYLLGDTGAEKQASREAIRFFNWPNRHEDRLDPNGYRSAEDYLFHQARLWFRDLRPGESPPQLDATDARKRAAATVRLGELLHQHQAFHELIRATERLTDFEILAADWQQKLQLPSVGQSRLLLNSLISLVAAARHWRDKDSDQAEKWCRPFLQVGQQLWLRELRRLVCSVPVGDETPAIRFADDLQNPRNPLHLPLLHCRECNMAAWGAVAKKGDNHLLGDLQSFYQAWFGYSPQSTLLVPWSGEQPPDGSVQGFCPRCLRLQTGGGSTCSECQEQTLLQVRVPDMLKTVGQDSNERLQCHHDCPECGARDSLAIVGYRAATLTSVMIGRLFSTPYNDDFKLIAFSDSVQDAAHRAGFLGANTWRQVVRQALANWLKEQPTALSLKEMTGLLPTYWRERIGHDGRFCGLFSAPNITWHRDYRALTETGTLPVHSELLEWVAKRLAWECVAEFGRRSAFGRSLERTGTASISLDWSRLVKDVRKLAERLREEVESLRGVDDSVFIRFVLGWLHHMRRIGAGTVFPTT